MSRNGRPRLLLPLVPALIVLALAAGCAGQLRNKELEKVAKDWSLVIRASQVIPVYPLSEDLQPGDVLLVSTPIEEQVALYKEKGFLPLDQHLMRLYPEDYPDFYRGRFGVTGDNWPPAVWQAPYDAGRHNWGSAPGAAFPSYKFSVEAGSGLSVALPIKGVPFAMGLMNTKKASGSVTIADAHTYGLDNAHLDSIVRDWARKQRALLTPYGPSGDRSHFLRVVSRVYVTGRVDVDIHNDEAKGAGANVGAEGSTGLLELKQDSTAVSYAQTMKAIDAAVAKTSPGGQLKIAFATSRTVSLKETFDRPLVIGYVGFDIPILKGGRLGASISTLAQLTARPQLPASPGGGIHGLAALAHLHAALCEGEQTEESRRLRLELDALASRLPERYPFTLYEYAAPGELTRSSDVVAGAAVERQSFSDIMYYVGNAQATVETLEGYLPQAPRQTEAQRSEVRQLERELAAARAALKEWTETLSQEPSVIEAIDYVFLGE